MEKLKLKYPNHLGIIMDGNGRWAQQRKMKRSEGHKEGAKTLKLLCDYIFNNTDINILSVYAFSTENFKREKEEVDYLMNLFVRVFEKEFSFLKDKNVKILFSGIRENLPESVLKTMDKMVSDTKNNTGKIFNICFNYGSQYEIVDATKKICKKVVNGEIKIEDINLETFNNNLYNDLPPLDLVIRTSGEQRISNFMLYQAAYSEFYFPKVLFPDFKENEFIEAIKEYNNRDRRFGGVNENKIN